MPCYDFYKERFNVTEWEHLKNKLTNLARPSYASRSSLKRKLDNAAFQAKKRDGKTVTMSLNEFKKSCSLANFRKAFQKNLCGFFPHLLYPLPLKCGKSPEILWSKRVKNKQKVPKTHFFPHS